MQMFINRLRWLVAAAWHHKKISLLLVVVVVGGVVWFSLGRQPANDGYVFGQVEPQTITEIVAESGTITADGQVPIYSPTNGLVTIIYASNGAAVKANQPLFKVVSSATAQEKQTARTSYLAAKAALAADQANLHTLQSAMFTAWKKFTDLSTNTTYQNADKSPNAGNRTAAEFHIAQDDWWAAEAAYQNQKDVVAKSQAAVASALTAYQATQTTTVIAPLAGLVANLAVAAGNSVQAPTAVNPTPEPVLVLQNSPNLQAVINVGQTNIAKIAVGQTIKIKPNAYKDRLYHGTVTRVDGVARNIQGVATYNVYAQIMDSDQYLRAGMTCDGDIITAQAEKVPAVPNAAVVWQKGTATVRTLQGQKLVPVPVTIGIKGDTHTQIIAGLELGQKIVVALTNAKAPRPGFMGL